MFNLCTNWFLCYLTFELAGNQLYSYVLNLMFNFTTTPVMPSKVTLFDLKCEPLFDFGTGPRNEVFYNPQGNNILTDYINIMLFFS